MFRLYASGAAREEPVLSLIARQQRLEPRSDPIEELLDTIAERIRRVADSPNKAEQARECRVLLLDHIARNISDHYLCRGGDEALRHVCLAAMYDLESDDEIKKKEEELLITWCYGLWRYASIACIYEDQFNSYMALEAFAKPYHAMTEFYMRLLATKLFSSLMNEHGSADQKNIADAYDEACNIDIVVDLREIRSDYYESIRKGFVENLYPLQQRFAKLIEAAQDSIEAAFRELRSADNT